jgi:outer membrane protein
MLLCAVCVTLAAPPAAAIDLNEAWQAAREHDPEFAAARAQWRSADTKRRQARALWRPQVVASGGVGLASSETLTHGAQFSTPTFGTSNGVDFRTSINGGTSARWELTAQQPLFNAQRRAAARQLDQQGEMVDVQYREAEQELILRVAQTYFDVLAAEDTRRLLQRQQEAVARALDEARERFDSGDTPVTDTYEALARFDAIGAQLLGAESDLQMKRVAFTDLTQLSADKLSRLKSGIDPDAKSAGALDDWLARAGESSPPLALQKLGREIAQREVDKYRALTSASVDLVARAGNDRLQGDGDFGSSRVSSSTRSIGVQLTIPLFTGGMRSAQRDEAAALAEKARFDVDATRQRVARQIRAAWLGVTTGAAQARAQEQALRSAAARLDATLTGKEFGARTTLDVLNAQTEYHATELALTQARLALLLNRLRLAAAAGELDEAQLHSANAELAP